MTKRSRQATEEKERKAQAERERLEKELADLITCPYCKKKFKKSENKKN